jgi:hypothetical protein
MGRLMKKRGANRHAPRFEVDCLPDRRIETRHENQ